MLFPTKNKWIFVQRAAVKNEMNEINEWTIARPFHPQLQFHQRTTEWETKWPIRSGLVFFISFMANYFFLPRAPWWVLRLNAIILSAGYLASLVGMLSFVSSWWDIELKYFFHSIIVLVKLQNKRNVWHWREVFDREKGEGVCGLEYFCLWMRRKRG